jgi:DNA-binding response OmpR family regulator
MCIPGRGAPLRVLVADDNRDAADSLAMLLRLWGHEAAVAYDGLAAVQTAADWPPDVVLLDVGMPRLDGYAVAQRLRGLPAGAPLVLAVTGYGDEAHRVRGRGLFDDYLLKPLDTNALHDRLAGWTSPRLAAS